MNDRLSELRGGMMPPSGGGGGGGPDLEAGAAGGSAFMQVFFDEVQEVKKMMSSIRYNIRQIEQKHGECLTAISAEQGRASTEQLDETMKSTNGIATQVQRHLLPPTQLHTHPAADRLAVQRRLNMSAAGVPRAAALRRCETSSKGWTWRTRSLRAATRARVRRASAPTCTAPSHASLLT